MCVRTQCHVTPLGGQFLDEVEKDGQKVLGERRQRRTRGLKTRDQF
jgi:hypothetical protein